MTGDLNRIQVDSVAKVFLLKEKGVNFAAKQFALCRVQVILSSEASKQAAINEAMGEAQAITARAQATAAGIRMVAAELGASGGGSAAQLRVAEQYVEVRRAGGGGAAAAASAHCGAIAVHKRVQQSAISALCGGVWCLLLLLLLLCILA
jgi:hypothetical protein